MIFGFKCYYTDNLTLKWFGYSFESIDEIINKLFLSIRLGLVIATSANVARN